MDQHLHIFNIQIQSILITTYLLEVVHKYFIRMELKNFVSYLVVRLIGESTNYANSNADDLIVGNRSNNESGITIGSSNQGQIAFANSGADRAGLIHYQHTDNSMRSYINGPTNERLRIDSSGNLLLKTGEIDMQGGNKTVKTSAGFLQLGTSGSQHTAIITAGSERLRIGSDGHLSYKNSSPPAWSTDFKLC